MPFKLTKKDVTVKFVSKETKKRMRLSVVAAVKAAVVVVMNDVGEVGDASLGGVASESYGGAGDTKDGLDSVSAMSSGVGIDKTGGEISDNDTGEEEDTGFERSPRL